jgi:hypothetical protein
MVSMNPAQGNESVIIPIIPTEGAIHLLGLYTRMELVIQTATPDQVVDAARSLWEGAQTKGDRAGAAELLAGRRIDAQEMGTSLPPEFTDFVYEGGAFPDLFDLMNSIVKAERAKRRT